MAESATHRELKRASVDWLKQMGCDAHALEVKLPLSNYRVDVAGYRSSSKMGELPGETFAIECKQSRADFLKDAGIERRAMAEYRTIEKRMSKLQELLAMHLPQCRLNESLFFEYDTFDFCDWRHDGWYRITRRLQILENQLNSGVKFAKIARYGCANYCYLAVDGDVVQSDSEIPMGWGLLRMAGDSLVRAKAPLRLDSKPSARLKLLERIAKARSGR